MESTTATKLSTHIQGRAIVERSMGGDLLVILPDGTVELGGDQGGVQRVTRRWAKKHANDAINVLVIEWRDGTGEGVGV